MEFINEYDKEIQCRSLSVLARDDDKVKILKYWT